jgi:hypothetical protein
LRADKRLRQANNGRISEQTRAARGRGRSGRIHESDVKPRVRPAAYGAEVTSPLVVGSLSGVAEFCDRRIDAQVRRADALQRRDPAAAGELWSRIDHELVDEASESSKPCMCTGFCTHGPRKTWCHAR